MNNSETQPCVQLSQIEIPVITGRQNNVLRRQQRRGAAAIFGIFLVAAIFTVLAVVSEHAYIDTARTELTRSADAAAVAGAWELYNARLDGVENADEPITAAASHYGAANSVGNIQPYLADVEDGVRMGHYDTATGTFTTVSNVDLANAVQVNLRMNGDAHGEIPLFFGGLTGRNSQSMQATAIAAFGTNISGFETPWDIDGTIDILPIALDEETWNDVLAKQTDDSFTYVDGEVRSGSDGFYECSLYPTGTGSPGNRGTVDVGSANNSTADLRRQIRDGISADDLDDLGKPLVFDSNGELTLNGDTGISAGIKSDLAAIIGDKRVIPIFESVSGNGNNANYKIVAWAGVRILSVKLTGPMRKKHLTIQPAPIIVRGAIADSGTTVHSSFVMTPAMLMQ